MSGKRSWYCITFSQDAQEIVEGAGLPEKTSQPSDEFDGALGEPLEAGNDEGHFAPGFFHPGGAVRQDFFPPFFLGGVAQAGGGEGGFVAHHKIVPEAQKDGLGGFGGDAAGPGFFLVEFIFELIVNFFKVPAAAVEQDDEAGGEFHFIGEIWPEFAAVGIGPSDAPDDAAGAGRSDEFVAGDALVDGGGGDVLIGHAGEVAVGFGTGDEVDPGLVLGFLEIAVVDDGAVPDEDDGPAFGGAAAQGVPGGALDDGDVVFLSFKGRITEVKVADGLGAQVDVVDVAGGVFGAFGTAGIVGGGGVPVAVAAEEFVGVQFAEAGEGIVHGAGHEAGEGFVEGLKVLEAAWAGESVEEAGAGRGAGDGALVGVEEGASAGVGPEDPGGPDEEPLGVFDAVAGAVDVGGDAELEEWFEEGCGEGEREGWGSHNNHKTAILALYDARGNPLKMAVYPLWRRAMQTAAPCLGGRMESAGYGGSSGKIQPRTGEAMLSLIRLTPIIYNQTREQFRKMQFPC